MIDASTLVRLLAVTVAACVLFAWWEADVSLEVVEEYATSEVTEIHCPRALPVDVLLAADATNAHGALATINSLVDTAARSSCSLARLRIFFFTTPDDVPLYRALFAATNSSSFHRLHLHALPPLDIPASFVVSDRFAQADRDLTASPNFVRLFIDKVADVANGELATHGEPPISRVLWLDTDVVVLRDVAPVFDSVLLGSRTSGPVIATSVTSDPHGYRVMFQHHKALEDILPPLKVCLEKEEAVLDPFCPHFNAGVMFLHVDRWRAAGVSTMSSLLLQANALLGGHSAKLWDHVSNPPLILLAFMFGVEHMPAAPQLHFRLDNLTPSQVEKVARTVIRSLPLAIHFNGDTKPWMRAMACEDWTILRYFKQNFLGYGCPFARTDALAAVESCDTLRPLGTRKDVNKKRYDAWCQSYRADPGAKEVGGGGGGVGVNETKIRRTKVVE
jgi:hypothetical protein